ncbi:hypothetical protein L1987_24121 [Smallanthus sonchifolius]|uniref:Uncharacterized protein n=1 Tax=Smallanthus sonchifolius TaxID=185202 RepID=A0ACB9ILA8_9ASTR|nr:hypothetical protein L1987_24121 [Smallanthus sonchifolius]
MDRKPLAIRIQTIRTHLQLVDTIGKFSFLDADVEQTFRDIGYGGNPKLIEGEMPNFSTTGKKLSSVSHSLRVFNNMKVHSLAFHGIDGSVANILQAQLVSMKVIMENNKLLKHILLSLAAIIPSTTALTPAKETEKNVLTTTTDDPQRIIPGTNMPLGLADELARRLQEQEDEAMRKESVERKLEVYQSRMAAKRKIQKKISQKESDKAQRKIWQNELVVSGKFGLKYLIGIKMSTLSEMMKQVRKDQVIAQQNISSTISQPSQPAESLKVKMETAEELKSIV